MRVVPCYWPSQRPAAADQPKAQPATVPFEMLQKGKLVSGHFTVQVKVNGKGPYRLIFDTGARDLAQHGSAMKLG